MTTFLALLRRDLVVTVRSARFLLPATLTQPILVVLVFGNILPRIGLVADEFRTVMIPGLMSITIMMSGVQGVLMPLAADLSGTREVDERLLAPITPFAVAFERIVAGAIHAAVAGLIALPLMLILVHEVAGVEVSPRWFAMLPLVAICGLLSAAFGLNLGTRIEPRYSGLLFAVVLGPMMLFGCAYYPYESLDVLGWLQYLFLVNPLVFMSEALRYAVTPQTPHMNLGLLGAGLLLFTGFLTWTGARSFRSRTIL